MKKLTLAVAAIALFLTTAALPSLADGFPLPTGGHDGHITNQAL